MTEDRPILLEKFLNMLNNPNNQHTSISLSEFKVLIEDLIKAKDQPPFLNYVYIKIKKEDEAVQNFWMETTQ